MSRIRAVPLIAFAALLLALPLTTGCSEEPSNPDAGETDGGTPDEDGGTTDDGGTTEEPGMATVTCDDPIPQPASGDCEITEGTSSKVVLRATVLGTDTIYEQGTLVFDQASGKIDCAGCDCAPPAGATVLACPDAVVSPGLINTHDHTTFSLSHPQGHGTERFDHRHDWRTGARGHSELDTAPGSDNSREGVLYGELRMLFGGATSISGSTSSTNASGLLRNLDKAADNGGLIGVDTDYRTFPLGDANGTMLTSGCNYPNVDSESRLSADIYQPHVSEGIDDEAQNEFRCLSTSAGADLVEHNTSIVHGVGLDAMDIAEMSTSGAKLIWSARTNVDLYGFTADVVAYDKQGVTIALGTDWSASGSMNMLREYQCIDSLNTNNYGGYFSDADLWRMGTYNAAISMGAEDQIGLLKAGYFADVALFDAAGKDPLRAILEAEVTDVLLVARAGEPLLGRSALVSALVPAAELDECEELDVCGNASRVCLMRDAGLTMANLTGAVSNGAYDLFFCGEPTDEPSCVPFREGEFDGLPTANDADGDGIPDADDTCPNVFNPPKPMNAMLQVDADGDGIGDECDMCPFNEGETCDPPNPDDRDADGIDNLSDNCPYDANADQADADGDGVGDVCDPCPNPDSCRFTVQDVRNPASTSHPAEGDLVVLQGLTVTAIGPYGFWAQDADATTPDFSGIYIYLNAAPAANVIRGAVVDVQGTYDEYYDLTELTNPTVTVVSQGTPLEPLVVAPADVKTGGPKTEAYESVLLMVENVTVTSANPDGTDDFNEFEVDGLRVDDAIYRYLDDGLVRTVGDAYTSITGVLTWGFSNSKLLPRDADDIVAAQ